MVNSGYKLFAVSCLTLAFTSMVLSVPTPPTNVKADPQNLKFTFGSKDEIPAAFFESTPLESPKNASSTQKIQFSPRVYPPCQDGSGGMCVDSGTCPSNLKPESSGPGACTTGQECCLGAPTTDKTCRSRGGECVPTGNCGRAPTFLEAEDCDKKNGQVCCIFV